MYFAVIDTNVLISALLSKNPDTATVKILRKILYGTIRPLFKVTPAQMLNVIEN